MSNPAVIALTYGGTPLQQDNLGIFFEVVRGINEAKEVRGDDLVVPGKAGRVARNRVLSRWPIELRGFVMGETGIGVDDATLKAAFRTNVATVRALFDPTRIPADLVATLEDATTVTVTARPLNAMWDVQPHEQWAEVSVELEAVGDWAS